MDPKPITPAEWEAIRSAIIFLWIFVFFMVSTAFSFLLAHGVIPSLIASRHISQSVGKVRPLFYLAAVGAFSTAAFLFASAFNNFRVLANIWTRWFL